MSHELHMSLVLPGAKYFYSLKWLCYASVAATAALVPESRHVCLAYATCTIIAEKVVQPWLPWAATRLASLTAVAYTLEKVIPYAQQLSFLTGMGAWVTSALLSTRVMSIKVGLGIAIVIQTIIYVCGPYIDSHITTPLERVLPPLRTAMADAVASILSDSTSNTHQCFTVADIDRIAELRCPGMYNTEPAADAADYQNPDTCSVCQEAFSRTMLFREMPCGHPFHASCVDPWLMMHRSCPTCRAVFEVPAIND